MSFCLIDSERLKHNIDIVSNFIDFHKIAIVIKNNAEGLIVRNDSAVYKVKKEETADLLITGYTLGKTPNQIRSISLGVFLNENEILHVG